MPKFLWPVALVVVGIAAFVAGQLSSIPPAPGPAPGHPGVRGVGPASKELRTDVPAPVEDFLVSVVKVERAGSYEERTPFGPLDHDAPCLLVFVEMKNASKARKYDGGRWPTGQLSDEHGNRYRLLTDNYVGRPAKFPDVLRPGESVRDVLVFEPPIPQARTLKLEWQDGFTSATGVPRGSVELLIDVAGIEDPEK